MEIFGWIAVLFYVIGGLQKSPRLTIWFSIVGNILFIAKYTLMAQYSPAVLMLSNTTCVILMMRLGEKWRLPLAAISFLTTSVFIFGNYASAFDVLIAVAALCIVYAQVNMNCYIRYKSGVLSSQILWVVYSATISDYAMITTCAFILTSNLYSLLVNMGRDIEEGHLVLAPSTAPLMIRVIGVATMMQAAIDTYRHLIPKRRKQPA